MEFSDAELTLDDLQNGYYIYQLKDGFRFGVDAVLLSDFAAVKKQESVIDLGTGTGIIPILLAAKGKGSRFTGLEIQEKYAALAGKSAEYNGLSEKISFVCGDIKNVSGLFKPESFDVCVSNPPYMAGNDGKHSEDLSRAMARHEVCCSLSDVVSAASYLIRTSGRFFLIHRPYRMAEIFKTMMDHHLEPKRIQFIYPYVDKEPTMVMIEALKGGKSGIVVEKPFIMYPGSAGEKDKNV